MSEGKPRARAAAPWDVAASICRGTNRDGPGLGGQRRPAGPRARKGEGEHVERDGPKWVCQRLAAEREAYHLLQPPSAAPLPQQAPGARLLLYPGGMLGMRSGWRAPSTATGASGRWIAPGCSGPWPGPLGECWLSRYSFWGGSGRGRSV